MASTCPICQGTGFEIRAGEGGVTAAVRCGCVVSDPAEGLRRNARIPKRYAGCNFESLSVETENQSLAKALAIVLEWITRWTPAEEYGLLLHGRPGTGKTHLAVALANELMGRKGADLVFYDQLELLNEIQATFDGSSGRAEAEILEPVRNAQVLVLDDLGSGRPTWWAHEKIHEILTYRYNSKLPLVITTNRSLEPEDIEEGRGSSKKEARAMTLGSWLGEALLSRLYEMCKFVPLRGKDYRQTIRNAEFHF